MSTWWLTIPLLSALIGYVTNWVAIRMLFRPHEEKRLWGVRVPFTPGWIPKRRADLARSIGRSVSRYLLTQEAIRARLEGPAVRAAVDRLVREVSARWLQRELPSVNELVPAKFERAWRNGVIQIQARLERWVASWLAHPDLACWVERQTEERLRTWIKTPLEQLVPETWLEALPDQASGLVQRVLSNDRLAARVEGLFSDRLDRWVEQDKCLADLLPEGVKQLLYDKLEDVEPLILERLVKVLADPGVRKRIKVQLFDLVDELLNKQFKSESVWDQFKFGLMESFVISPEEMKARIEEAVDAAAPKVGELVRREDVQEKIHQALVEAIETFLQRKISELHVAPETLQQVRGGLGRWVVSLLQSQTFGAHLNALVSEHVARYRGQSLSQLLPELSDETLDRAAQQVSARLLQWVRGETLHHKVVDFIADQAERALDRPLGRLDRFIPEETLARGQRFAGDQAITLLVQQTPRIVEGLDVEQLVADQVSEFSLDEVERLVVGITGNHLQAITWFGAVLGFVLGLVQLGLLLLS